MVIFHSYVKLPEGIYDMVNYEHGGMTNPQVFRVFLRNQYEKNPTTLTKLVQSIKYPHEYPGWWYTYPSEKMMEWVTVGMMKYPKNGKS